MYINLNLIRVALQVAHERHGTWVLLDGPPEPPDRPSERDERPGDGGGGTVQEKAENSGKVGLPPPHIVHMNGRSFLPPDVKRKVEAEFRRQAAGGEGGGRGGDGK